MRLRFRAIAIAGAGAALGALPVAAQARHGADDPVGHRHHGHHHAAHAARHGDDDPAGHDRGDDHGRR